METQKTSDDDVLLEHGLKNIYHNAADPWKKKQKFVCI